MRKPFSTGRLSTHLNFATPLTTALECLAEGAGIGMRQVAMAWQVPFEMDRGRGKGASL